MLYLCVHVFGLGVCPDRFEINDLAVHSGVIVLQIKAMVLIGPKYFANIKGLFLATLNSPVRKMHSIMRSPFSNSKHGSGLYYIVSR